MFADVVELEVWGLGDDLGGEGDNVEVREGGARDTAEDVDGAGDVDDLVFYHEDAELEGGHDLSCEWEQN